MDALRLSLEQFGREGRLQYDWQHECELTRLDAGISPFLPGFRFALRSFGTAFLLAGLSGALLRLTPSPLPAPGTILAYWYPILLMIELSFAFLAGYRVGRHVRHRPMLVSLAAAVPMCLLIPTIVPVLGLTAMLFVRHQIESVPGIDWFHIWCNLAVPVLSITPLFGAVGAAVGQFSRPFRRSGVASPH